jgi:hypothetical protein
MTELEKDSYLKDEREIYVPHSEVLHFWKLIREGSMSVSEFADVWNDSIQRSIEAALRNAQQGVECHKPLT